MSRSLRFFWMLTLACFVGGCSSYRTMPFPDSGRGTDPAAGREPNVEVGDRVRITLADDSQAEGKIMAATAAAITLEPVNHTTYTKYPENLTKDELPRVIAIEDVRIIEKAAFNVVRSFVLTAGIAALVGTAVSNADLSMEMPSVGQ